MLSLPSFTCIPGWLYCPLFHWFILLLMSLTIVHAANGSIYLWNTSPLTRAFGKGMVFLLILYIGLRPTTSYYEYPFFTDTFSYKASILNLKELRPVHWLDTEPYLHKEWLFECIEALCAFYADEHLEFLIAASVYVGCSALFCQRIFEKQWFVPFLMFCATFSFFSSGVNIVRNSMAASLFILALSFREKKWVAVVLCVFAVGIHKSLMLMISSAILALMITNSRYYITGWLICIALVIAAGPSIGNWIGSSGIISDERLVKYGVRDESNSFGYYTGFRADFLLYSALPVISGAYFIFKKKFQDKFYMWLYNIYLTCNAFWVLMMYAAFNDRFAHLSWFIMPFVLGYPWFKKAFFSNQSQRLGVFLLVCYAYTFYANILQLK